MLSAFVGAAVKTVRNSTFTDTIQILTNSGTDNGAGGVTDNWNIIQGVPGRIDRTMGGTAGVQEQGAQAQPIYTWEVRVDVSVVVTTANRLRVGSNDFIVRSTDVGRSDALVQIIECDLVISGVS